MVASGEAWSFEIILPAQTDKGLRSMDSFCEFAQKISLVIFQLNKEYCAKLKESYELLHNFEFRFDEVYPNRPAGT